MENETPHFGLEKRRPHRLLLLHWHGFVPSQVYRDGLLEAVQETRQGSFTNWVMDMKAMKVIRQADQDWTLNDWFARFKLLGIQRLGLVVSDDIFNQMAVSSMIAIIRPKTTTEIEYFQELSEAIHWAQEGDHNISDLGLFSV